MENVRKPGSIPEQPLYRVTELVHGDWVVIGSSVSYEREWALERAQDVARAGGRSARLEVQPATGADWLIQRVDGEDAAYPLRSMAGASTLLPMRPYT
jgi:hypothetical protein